MRQSKRQLENNYGVVIVERDKELVKYGEKYMVYHNYTEYTGYVFKNLEEVQEYLRMLQHSYGDI